MRGGLFGLALVGLMASNSGAAGDLAGAIRECSTNADDHERLICYDLLRCSLETDDAAMLACVDEAWPSFAASIEQLRDLLLSDPLPHAAPPGDPEGADDGEAMFGQGDLDAIASRLRQCWNVDPGAALPDVIEIRLRVDPATSSPVRSSVEIVSGDGPAAQAARRAILNPACQPWPTPAHGWPAGPLVLRFDPRDMF